MTSKDFKIIRGLRFTWIKTRMKYEIAEVFESTCDVIISYTEDGDGWVEKGWNLKRLYAGFQTGEYLETKPSPSYSII